MEGESRCPKCQANAFEVATLKPANWPRLVTVLRCAACGSVVGVVPELVRRKLASLEEAVKRGRASQ